MTTTGKDPEANGDMAAQPVQLLPVKDSQVSSIPEEKEVEQLIQPQTNLTV